MLLALISGGVSKQSRSLKFQQEKVVAKVDLMGELMIPGGLNFACM